mmetsp:Transcript_9129/g.19144  ORF Transcript_9129/g.19144 Transcript_9129/m.19144 type:complete len:362 (+) Transcript_9129:99-1184(+)|eukprot:CAMPEP_0201118922 /NCGR_PEP_ID=MMETSP0850-20130426/3119_1 /ASSEMBLY_ACC=CAM_ASM_000622 /TAXON_ID=183588 /ORGANISM="Pseudo-nitzschia fraudulenta, Strain WWA7" /LENGTH=361 /DNA_ID=CAMNT_0047384425 /DNA_START=42 /DNA_END=1127 /DNA_ORIENTATION=+
MCGPIPKKKNSEYSGGNRTSAAENSIQDLVRCDQGFSYLQVVFPVFRHFWENFVSKAKNKLLALLLAYLILGGLNYAIPGNGVIRVFVYAAFLPPSLGIALFIYLVKSVTENRLPAFESAQNILVENIKAGRAKRKKGAYDLYYPELPSVGAEKPHPKVGIIFCPGALVDHTSYAPFATALSNRGFMVAVISMEPSRLVGDLDVIKENALDAMHEILSLSDDTVDEWVLAGHSMGALLAMNLLVLGMVPGISKLILCGIGSNAIRGDGTLRDASIQALVLNGTKDNYLTRKTEEERNTLRDALPPTSGNSNKGKTTYVTIEGGNHAGFGHYGPQKRDGTRTIPLEEQQRIFVEKTVEFLTA